MRPYHLLLFGSDKTAPRRAEFLSHDPYQPFQAALNERTSREVELWEGDRLLVRMTKSDANLWKLQGAQPRGNGKPRSLSPAGNAAA